MFKIQVQVQVMDENIDEGEEYDTYHALIIS